MFTLAFWKNIAEVVATTFAATLAGSLALTTTPSAKGLEAAAIAAGVGAVAAGLKQLGAVQRTAQVLKVAGK